MAAMESLAEGAPLTARVLVLPRFQDGTINMQELLRQLAEAIANEIMDAGAGEMRGDGNSRNGYRDRKLETCVGALTLRVPKLRHGSFFPNDLLTRYQRTDRAASTAVVIAIGCDEYGWHYVLGLAVVDTESYDSWSAFLRSIREVFQGSSWQRYVARRMRDRMREASSRG